MISYSKPQEMTETRLQTGISEKKRDFFSPQGRKERKENRVREQGRRDDHMVTELGFIAEAQGFHRELICPALPGPEGSATQARWAPSAGADFGAGREQSPLMVTVS